MVKKIIFDSDIGSDVDDAYALLYAVKSDDLELQAVTTVYGKTDLRARLARKLLYYAGLEKIRVCVGESEPIRSVREVWHTGLEGKGVLEEEDFAYSLRERGIQENAPKFLVDEIMNECGKSTIVSIGALTNVARALRMKPEIKSKIEHHYIMGGCFGENYPEHNIACDVRAAQIVFSNDYPKTLIPLDITSKTDIGREELYDLRKGDKLQRAVSKLSDVWFSYKNRYPGEEASSTCMHDPLTLAVINHPELVESKVESVKVDEEGVTYFGGNCPVNVGIGINEEKFKEHFLDVIYR
ncbi:nucleoside hydrolase [archaeon]|jgi:purine nucleosidase|nr:nucleoside hydrolase [archaeon]